MTTIIMLPTAAPPPTRPTPSAGPGGEDRFGPALDRAIDADNRAGRRDDASRPDRRDETDRSDRSDRSEGSADRDVTGRNPAEGRATGRPDGATGADGSATAADETRAADGSGRTTDGAAETTGSGKDAQATATRTVTEIVAAASELLADVGGAAAEGDVAVVPADGEGEMADVIDLDSRRHATATKASGAPGTQTQAGTGAVGTAGTAATGTQAAVPGSPVPGAVAVAADGTGDALVNPTAGTAPATRAGTATAAVDPSAQVTTEQVATTDPAATTARAASAGAEPTPASSGSQVPVTHTPTAAGGVGQTHVNATAEASPTSAGAAPSATPDPRALADQLGVRLASLRGAGPGQHTLTLRVDPESFGPVRVVAHIGAEGVRIELLGASDHAREALRAALPDLRRDLAGAGLEADLGLGEDHGATLHGETGADAGQDGERAAAAPTAPGGLPGRTGTDLRPAHHTPVSDRLVGLDLLV